VNDTGRSEPTVGVVVPVYNAGPYLRAAVESVLAQTWRALEIWVIDDGSTDGCMETIADLADPRLRVLHQANAGKSATLNRFLDEQTGEFFAVQDADDLCAPHRIEAQVTHLLANPELAACFSGHELILDGRRVAPRFRGKSQEECARDIDRLAMPAHDPTAMFRTAFVGDLRFDPALALGEGYDFTLRLGERYPISVLGECLYSYRIHPHSITHRDPLVRRAQVQDVARRANERRGRPPLPARAIAPRRSSRNRERDNNLLAHLIESTIDQRRAGDLRGMLATAVLGPRLQPFDWEYYKPLACSLAPLAVIDRLRRAR
jgi:glycosyltransferase involved in cell wall biosynthesis